MQKILLSALLLLLVTVVGCESEDYYDFLPDDNSGGDFFYTSYSDYYKYNGKLDRSLNSIGFLSHHGSASGSSFVIIPDYGWSYDFYTEELSDEGSVKTFKINPQKVRVNGKSFSISGYRKLSVRNDEGVLLQGIDGYFKGDSIVFQYKSLDIETGEWVFTRTECVQDGVSY